MRHFLTKRLVLWDLWWVGRFVIGRSMMGQISWWDIRYGRFFVHRTVHLLQGLNMCRQLCTYIPAVPGKRYCISNCFSSFPKLYILNSWAKVDKTANRRDQTVRCGNIMRSRWKPKKIRRSCRLHRMTQNRFRESLSVAREWSYLNVLWRRHGAFPSRII